MTSGSSPLRPLEEVCLRVTDGTHQSPRFETEGVPFLVISDVVSGEIVWEGVSKWVSRQTYETHTARCRPERGDVLYTAVGSFGVAVPVDSDQRFMFQRHIAHIKPDLQRVDTHYLAHILNSPKIRREAERVAKGVAQRTVTLGDLKRFEIPVPPLPEQRRIADILDKADTIRRKRKEAIALTEDLIRSTFLEIFGDPVTNPKRWQTKPLGDLADIVGGGTPSRARHDFYEGTTPWATAKDFRADTMATTQEHISDEAIRASATKLVGAGTILVVVKSKILMRRLPVAVATTALCFNQDVKGIVVRRQWESAYVAAHLRMAERALLKLARGVNTEGLTIQHLRTHAVMRPPEHLVHRFSQIEETLRRALERESEALRQSEKLFNGVVEEAFRGGLSARRPVDAESR